MRVRALLATACAVTALAAPSALAQGSFQDTRSRISLQYSIASDGKGILVANPPDGHDTIGWARCPDGGADCTPVASDRQSDRVLHVGDAPAGTVFEATASTAGRTVVERSVPYQGRVRSTEPPALAGAPRVNSFVQPIAGKWEGGWGREASYLQLQVCRTYEARQPWSCLVISDSVSWNACPGAGATIAERYAGWYLRAVDRRNGADTPMRLVGYLAPETIAPDIPGPSVAATAPTRILPATGPPARRCGQSHMRHSARLYPRVNRRLGNGKPAIGELSCLRGCRFTVTVRRRDWSVTFLRRAAIGTFSRDVLLPPQLLARLRGTRPRITVRIDGRKVASRRVAVPPARRGARTIER